MTRPNWRTAAAALPAVALIGSGLALVATDGNPSTDVVADSRPLVTVPKVAVQRPEAPSLPPLPELPAPPEASATPVSAAPGLQLSDAASANGIPAAALAAYRRGAQLVDAADPECNIDWALLAGIGKVESNHGRYGGNGIDSTGTVRPGIYGIPLNGSNNTAVIRDTDQGIFDRDTTFDRAVGPMQFIPGTWRSVGVDANGDGRKDPQNLMDAVTGAAVYLCSGPGNLGTESGARTAVLRYNQSDAYADEVLALAGGYRGGYAVVPDGALTAAQSSGQPFLPTGNEVQQPGPAAGVAGGGVAGTPGSKSKPKPSAGTAKPSPSSTSGSGSGGSGAVSGGSGGSGSTPAPSTTAGGGSLAGTVGSVVGGVVGGVTGQTPTPSSSPTPSPSSSTSKPTPSSTPTTPALPLTVAPVNGTCPTAYDPVLNVLKVVVLCKLK
ncbi:lytic transglycosylase domain-containing protein [Pedococcus sp. KACC 23699]|uniref:Lytic transglycosylase domain-containing protein n=1 Tax=Pedococcus sp. KACC 23699 TaxID=3149228 RepID=A0AAU7JWZ4_9MICO